MKLLKEGSVHLAKWLRAQQEDDCTHVILRQRTAETDQQVREWNLAAAEDLDALAAEIETRAQEDGQHFRGPTLYGLFAYREVGKAHVERTFLRVEGQGGRESFFQETEAPDGRGITSQLMRHNEVATRIALGQTSEIMEFYKRALEQRDRRIEDLENRHFKMLELYEKLQSMQHERDLEVVREQRADERTKFLKEKLDMLAPVLMNKLLGKEGATAPALGEELMRQFLKSLAPNQIDALMGMLRPEQAAVIGEVYDAYVKREMERESPPPSAPSPTSAKKNGGGGEKKTNGTAHEGE